MKICVPIGTDNGLKSSVYGHFGSAPFFLLADSQDGSHKIIGNTGSHHEHGMCDPLRVVAGENIACLIVAGIGAGALHKVRQAGIRVFYSEHETVEQVLAAFKAGMLSELTPGMACSGHGAGSNCHGHD